MSRQPTVAQLLGERVTELRERQQLSQADLARLSGLTRSQIFVLEQGERASTIVTVSAVAKALKVPLSELFVTGATANPGPDRADVIAERIRALGPEAMRALEAMADALDAAKRGNSRHG